MKKIRASLYRALYYWALKGWRKSVGNNKIRHQKQNLSYHGMIRYMERIEGYDYSGLRDRILTDEVRAKVNELGGDGRFQIGGIIYVFMDHKLVTVYKAEGMQKNIVMQNSEKKVWSF